MSIFGKIMGAIFGTKADAAPAGGGAAAGAGSSAGPAGGSAAAPAATVDVAPILDKAVAAKGEKLAWRTSIVDLMKALDINSSFTARKELAKELGYTGDSNDSASMNIWLHKQVMTKLAANGGSAAARSQGLTLRPVSIGKGPRRRGPFHTVRSANSGFLRR